MSGLREMSERQWLQLPLWTGLHYDDENGKQYRGTFRDRYWVITVVKRRGVPTYSTSEEVEVR